mgnify:CR=1 FL=1
MGSLTFYVVVADEHSEILQVLIMSFELPT